MNLYIITYIPGKYDDNEGINPELRDTPIITEIVASDNISAREAFINQYWEDYQTTVEERILYIKKVETALGEDGHQYKILPLIQPNE